MSKYITQKEIAALVEMSPRSVKNHEHKWGLVRIKGFIRPRFERARTLLVLRTAGVLPD